MSQDEVKAYRCRVCDIAVPYPDQVHKKMLELQVCYEHWKTMI